MMVHASDKYIYIGKIDCFGFYLDLQDAKDTQEKLNDLLNKNKICKNCKKEFTTKLYKCFYCKEYFCEDCAGEHFDRKKILCSGHGVFPDGTKCKGCPDCCKEFYNKKLNQEKIAHSILKVIDKLDKDR